MILAVPIAKAKDTICFVLHSVGPGKLHEASKQMRKKAKEELAIYGVPEEDILIIARHVSAEILNNIG